jgi:L-rhamnose mutarotase
MACISKRDYTCYKRYCKTLSLENDPQLIEEYKKVHSPGNTWPEISRGMTDVGIVDMEIYIMGNQLFMIMDTIPEFDHDREMAALATRPRQSEWEAFVSRFQKSAPGATAGEKWQLMERIYKLERER